MNNDLSSTSGGTLGGRYRLQTRLGRGGVADVWCAFDERLERRVAVKVFRPESTNPERERSEMRLLANLAHPGLVTVYDAGTADDANGAQHSYLVMELVDGPTLRQTLDGGPLPSPTVAEAGRQLAAALAYIHRQTIVHRDVKPANILLASHPAAARPGVAVAVKLADFGIARQLDAIRYTEDGTTVGTPNYISPEQVRGLDIGPASDVYSLGLVLLECLTGEVVYPGHGVEAAVVRLHREPRVPARFGPLWTELLGTMLREDPAARVTAEDVSAALTNAGDNAMVPVGPRDTAALGPANTVARGPANTAAAGSTQVLSAATAPAAGRPAAGVRRWTRRTRLVAAGTGVLVAAAIAVTIATTGSPSGKSPMPAPTYPSVTGKLGRDLSTLQRDVQP